MLIPFDHLFEHYNIRPSGVLHLGANTGQEAEVYHGRGVKRVIWVEAIPELFEKLKRNVARWPQDITYCACVSDVNDERVRFQVASNGGQSSSFLEFGTHAVAHPSVRFIRNFFATTIRVDRLLAEEEIEGSWFLNADLQGAELKALIGMGQLLWKFDHAYIEVNEDELYKGCPRTKDVDEYLAQFGFVGVETKMTGAGWGDKYYVRTR